MTLTCSEVYLNTLAVNTIEQSLNSFHRNQLSRNLEAKRINTLIQDVEGLFVSLLWIINNNVLTDVPLVGILLVSTYEWEFSWESIRCLKVRQIFAAIEGLYIKTLVCSPYQALLEIGTLKVDFNLVQPFLFGWRCELGKELFFVCHSFYTLNII